jgi:pyruvate/2-oxoglutarate dehydrogenase complex dihydrolipoamide dehydrogenase (E3) component
MVDFLRKADFALTIMKTFAAQEASPQVVIVGGGSGGLSTTRRKGVRVTIIDRTNHHQARREVVLSADIIAYYAKNAERFFAPEPLKPSSSEAQIESVLSASSP